LRTTSSHPSHPPSLHDALPIFTTTVETDQPLCNFQLLPSITTHAAKHSPLTELTARVLHRTAGRCYSTTRHASSHHLDSGVAIPLPDARTDREYWENRCQVGSWTADRGAEASLPLNRLCSKSRQRPWSCPDTRSGIARPDP